MSWFCFGGVLEYALMFVGLKIAFSHNLHYYNTSPQPGTNGSISSGFDEGPSSEKTKCVVIG